MAAKPRARSPASSSGHGVPGDHDLAGREGGGRGREGDRHPVGAARDEPVGESGDDDLLVDQQGAAPGSGGERGRHRHEPAGRDDHVGPQAAEQPPRLRQAGGNADCEVGDVPHGEAPAQLPGRDRVIRDAGGRDPRRLEPGAAADPGQLDGVAQSRAQARRDGEPGRRVPAGAAPRDEDAEGRHAPERFAAYRSSASSIRRSTRLG